MGVTAVSSSLAHGGPLGARVFDYPRPRRKIFFGEFFHGMDYAKERSSVPFLNDVLEARFPEHRDGNLGGPEAWCERRMSVSECKPG